MIDSAARPTFNELAQEFSKMARDPGRYLVIDGDQLKRAPTLKINNEDFGDFSQTDEYPDRQFMGEWD